MQKPERVRIANENDIADLFWFLRIHLEQDNGMGLTVSDKKVLRAVQNCCRGTHGIAGIIESPDGQIIGSTAIAAMDLWYSEEWFLAEVWLTVHPGHRAGTTYEDDLFQFGKWHREDMQMKLGVDRLVLQTSVTSRKRLDAKTRLWRRKGGEHVGSIFWIGTEKETT